MRIGEGVGAVDVDEIELGVGRVDLQTRQELVQRLVILHQIVAQRAPDDQRATAGPFLAGDGEKTLLRVDLSDLETEQPIERFNEINRCFLRLPSVGGGDLERVAERVVELVEVEQAGTAS